MNRDPWYPNKSMRIAHFSDPHLLSLEGARVLDFANKRWIGGLNLLANRGRHHRVELFEALIEDLNAGGVDHVLGTGDITNLALEEEFRFARALIDRIRLTPREMTIIPGNHDAYVAAGVKHFASYFGDFYRPDDEFEWGPEDRWPVVRVRGPMALFCVSTSLETPWFTAWGRCGSEQLDRLRRALSDPRLDGKFRLVAIHHPPAGRPSRRRVRGLRDRDAFADVLAEVGAELVLHGHEHLDLREELPGPGGAAIPVRGIQSVTYEAKSELRRARYRIYEIAGDEGGRARLAGETLRVWSPKEERFVEDLSPGLSAARIAT